MLRAIQQCLAHISDVTIWGRASHDWKANYHCMLIFDMSKIHYKIRFGREFCIFFIICSQYLAKQLNIVKSFYGTFSNKKSVNKRGFSALISMRISQRRPCCSELDDVFNKHLYLHKMYDVIDGNLYTFCDEAPSGLVDILYYLSDTSLIG